MNSIINKEPKEIMPNQISEESVDGEINDLNKEFAVKIPKLKK